MTQRYKPNQPDKDKALTAEIKKLAERHKRYGYRMITAKLTQDDRLTISSNKKNV